MNGKFMSVKRLIIPMMSFIIMTSQLLGCSVVASADMVKMIDSGQEISIEVAAPNYDIAIKGTQDSALEWTQLDQLKSYNNFRQDFDKAFNINTVTENGINGKSGCLFVDESGDRNGNTSLIDVVRNKTFVTKYWADNNVKDAIAKASGQAYTDLAGNETYQIAGAINAYFNLIPGASNPSSFNPTESMSREAFYSMLYRATNGVQQLSEDGAFDNAVGGKTNFTAYAAGIDEKGFLSVTNKSLDGNSYKGSISRAEAVYMIVNTLFPDELAKVTGKEAAFNDTKNAGDLALIAGFKTKQADGTYTKKDRCESYTLAYMMQHPNDGLDENLYKAMVVAKAQGLIDGSDSRWDEPISNSEAVVMVVNSGLAMNKLYGYKSEAEYGKINQAKFQVMTQNGVDTTKKVIEATKAESTGDPAKILSSGMTLRDARVKIDSLIAGIKAMGDTVDNNKAYLEQQCEAMGTTLDEVNSLPELATKTQAEGAAPHTNGATTQKQAQSVAPKATQTAPKQETQAPAQSQVTQSAPAASNSSGSSNKYTKNHQTGTGSSSGDGSLANSIRENSK